MEERGAEFYSMLLFKSLTASHSGIYTCVVTNTAGKANTSTELAIKGMQKNPQLSFVIGLFPEVLNKCKYFTVPPYWQIEPGDTAVLLNGSLTVSCEARGHPPPTIYWTKFSGET